jgi:high mobility group protein B2
MEKPKRPLSSYMLWLNSVRKSIKEENPDFKVTDIAKKGGELWRGMAKEDKTEWEEKAGIAKQQYSEDMDEFERNGGDKNAGSKKRGKAPKKAPAKKVETKDSSEEEESD